MTEKKPFPKPMIEIVLAVVGYLLIMFLFEDYCFARVTLAHTIYITMVFVVMLFILIFAFIIMIVDKEVVVIQKKEDKP